MLNNYVTYFSALRKGLLTEANKDGKLAVVIAKDAPKEVFALLPRLKAMYFILRFSRDVTKLYCLILIFSMIIGFAD